MDQYQEWETAALSTLYCYRYGGTSSTMFKSDSITVKHSAFLGNVEPGVYWEWKYTLDSSLNYKIEVKWDNYNDQDINIDLTGKDNSTIVINKLYIRERRNSFVFYDASEMTIRTVQIVGGSAPTYE